MTGATSDLSRDIICLLGVPFDLVTTEQALEAVRAAVRTRQRLFLSTPNLFFLVHSQRDRPFRQAMIESDLSVADGMPLVWMSRWLGVPLPERVTGADLFERLSEEPVPASHSPIKVYFFGGPPGAAQTAGRTLNASVGGMRCVGYANPGFGSVDSLSTPAIIRDINASQADFLVVALGAVKGQEWIQRNRERLQVPVISHLGAVINFAARTVSRAPLWMQRIGLEWLWRIKEEPGLWRRYANDAVALSRLVVGCVLPYRLWLRKHCTADEGQVTVALQQDDEGCRILISGTIPDPVPSRVRTVMRQACDQGRSVELDLTQVECFGPSFGGLLLMLEKTLTGNHQQMQIGPLSPQIRRVFGWSGLSSLLDADG